MPTMPLERKTREVILLALISLFAVASLRFPIESVGMLSAEVVVVLGCFVGMMFARARSQKRLNGWMAAALFFVPIACSFIGRSIDAAIAFEMTALTVFGTGALALATFNARTRAMSLVTSGFLTLFATVISDHPSAVGIAIAWITVCVWHLVANHWERIDLCAVDEVSRGGSVRPLTVALAIMLFVVGGLAAKDRFGESNRFQVGFMPTSGGSEWSDAGATSGIGSGEAAIAAKDRAESFGAVDSEIFLETTGSTLFDMFSDSIGEPKVKIKWERRQGMSSKNVEEAHTKTARSDKGSNSFSTDRFTPKKHLHLKDISKNALVQWSGPTGIRLAMNRYDTFDGVDWKNDSKLRNEHFVRKKFGDDAWFFEPMTAKRILKAEPSEISQGTLKIVRLDSVRMPVPMMTSGVHIKDIDREDFFGVEHDGSFYMPGRERVPPLTVVHVASLQVLEDYLIQRVNDRPNLRSDGWTSKEISRLTKEWTRDHSSKYDQLRSIVSHLRTEFDFNRSADLGSESHIIKFLKEREGGDHLFASVAALMAKEIGLQSRVVTGLYVRPTATEIAAGHSNVLPSDVHAWVEINLGDGFWFEIEPTPGFKEPVYAMSWWLASKKFAANHWQKALALVGTVGFVHFTRLIWAELILTLFWMMTFFIGRRRRLALAIRIIELRAKLLGHARPSGSPTREWLLNDVAGANKADPLRGQLQLFCDLADRLCFGDHEGQSIDHQQFQVVSGVVEALPMRALKKTLSDKRS